MKRMPRGFEQVRDADPAAAIRDAALVGEPVDFT